MIVTEESVEAYLERFQSRRGPSGHTVRAYRSDLRDYLGFIRGRDVDETPANAVMAYVRQLMTERCLSPRTVRRRIASLRGLYGDPATLGRVAENPFVDLKLQLPRVKQLPRALAREDAARLAQAAWRVWQPSRGVGRQVAVAVLLLISVGLRVGELVQLRATDFDDQSAILHVRGKGRRERRVPVVDPKLAQGLGTLAKRGQPHLFGDGDTAWSTQSFRHRLKHFARAAGVTRHVTPHMLRHTSATLHLEDGVDLLFLQRMLGHESISTTALYAHVADASLKRALEKAGLLTTLAAA